jgi:hypothetical protein
MPARCARSRALLGQHQWSLMKIRLRWVIRAAIGLSVLFAMAFLMKLFRPEIHALRSQGSPQRRQGMPVAIIGDSASQSYRGTHHGGAYHYLTWGWTDIWDMLRPSEVNLGALDAWGTGYQIARIRARLGLPARAPHKLDFEYDYAESGMGCDSLLNSEPQAARWLLDRVGHEPERWNQGLVVIRIGGVDLARYQVLDRWSETGLDPYARAAVHRCVDAIGAVVQGLRRLGTVKIALAGVGRPYNKPHTEERWPDDSQVQRMAEVLDYYDAQLKQLADSDRSTVFLDDITWYRERLGDRKLGSLKSTFSLGTKVIRRSYGDDPENFILADMHHGTIFSGLWLNHLVSSLNAHFGLSFTPIREDELLKLIEPAGGGASQPTTTR